MKVSRRSLLTASALGAGACLLAPSELLASPKLTPFQTRGPFYPDELPLNIDNDLIRLGEGDTDATGVSSLIQGVVRDERGKPLQGVKVEIWQCDAQGRYLHSGDSWRGSRDLAFQGYGQTISDKDGRYNFRTIKPVAYTGRTPHIHFALSGPTISPFSTQMYVAGEQSNRDDFLYSRIRKSLRHLVTAEFSPVSSGNVELIANFDLFLATEVQAP